MIYDRERVFKFIEGYDELLPFLLTLGPFFIFFIVIWIIPIFYAITMSFFSEPVKNPEFTFIGNYLDILLTSQFWHFLFNSIVYALSTTILSLLIGLGLALAINRSLKGGFAFRTIMIFPYLIPTIVVVFMWKFILDQNVGALNIAMEHLGVIDKPIAFFAERSTAMASVVVTSVWKYSAFAFFILLARLQIIHPQLYERAKIEGATTYQTFRDITLPQLRSAILIILLVRGVWMFNKFDIIWLSTRGGPLSLTTTLPIRVYELAFFDVEFGHAAAMSTIMFSFLTVAAVIYFRYFNPEEEVNS